MTTTLKLDIVSDVSCPWCIIGYKALEKALRRLAPNITAQITWQPFELNPAMPPEGQDIVEHITEKYGISVAQSQQNRAAIKQRGLEVGYSFGERVGGRIYNTFDAHRLLHWAEKSRHQMPLKLGLFDLYFKAGGNPSDHQQLLEVVANSGLDVATAAEVLDSKRYSQEVRAAQQQYQRQGISAVPAVIVNEKYVINGGQPSEIFEQALRDIADQIGPVQAPHTGDV